ncbi:hypothetical protein O181_068161 [Austropuccinia psidii MF-1]|uniref:Uncharacterized protein n=1 Tax=Austropuccinia psidii MF-1 TaxID=1389203 RepID=A0A9Q3I3P7_9BASI|nr:hypothetical protein [Austropuccinia psidii MF-1]
MLPTLQPKFLQVSPLICWEEALQMSRSAIFDCKEILVESKGWAIDWIQEEVFQRWTNDGGSIPTCGRPIYSSSEVPISRIKNQVIVKRTRIIAYFPTTPDGEGSDELDGEEVESVDQKAGQLQNSSPSNPPSGTLKSQIISSTPRNFQLRLAAVPFPIHQSSPHPSTARPPELSSSMSQFKIT